MDEQTSPAPQSPSLSQQNNNNASKPIKNRMYPELIIPNNTHPNKLYAFPLVGLVIKIILVIPAYIVYAVVGFISGVFLLITPFVILFKGKYWDKSYEWNINFFIYGAKIQLYLTGISDKYPGFTLEPNGMFEMHLPKPESPSRLMAFPVGGFIGRYIIMFPYLLFLSVLSYGMHAAVVFSWFAVWIKGTYPESLYEFIRDELRVSLAYDAYMAYLSDTYPSSKISMNHKKIKIALIIIGTIVTLAYFGNKINQIAHPTHDSSYYNSTSNTTDSSGY